MSSSKNRSIHSGRTEDDKVRSPRSKVVEKLTLTAGAIVCMIPASVEADVIMVEDRPLSVGPLFFIDGNWDVDGDGTYEFTINTRSSVFSTVTTYRSTFSYRHQLVLYSNQSDLNGRGFIGPNHPYATAITNLDTGFRVGPTLNDLAWNQLRTGGYTVDFRNLMTFVETGPPFGPFNTSRRIGYGFQGSEGQNYVGFRFDKNGNTHYGWAEWNLDLTGAGLVTISRWAYESTPDTGLLVNQIPEPSSLAMLGLGAGGLLALRRRKGSKTTGK